MNTESETRPWGTFKRFTHNEFSTVKIISINPNQELSLQYHDKRQEFWRVLSGNPIITVGEKSGPAAPGDEFFVDVKTPHRMKAQEKPVDILEIALGDFDEKDIVRLEDRYGRA